MPFGQLDAAAEIELVVLPDADDGRHHFDALGQLVDALHQPPGLRRIAAQLFIEPVAVHDVEMNFAGPIAIEVFVSRRAMAEAAGRVLIRARADLEAKVEQALWDCAARLRVSSLLGSVRKLPGKPCGRPLTMIS